MATDTDKQLAHQPRNVQELAKAANEAWQVWENRPHAREVSATENGRWSIEHGQAMDHLGAALSLFGLGPSGAATDPRQVRPVANAKVFGNKDPRRADPQ